MLSEEVVISNIRSFALEGESMSNILRYLIQEVKSAQGDMYIVRTESFLIRSFNIPLPVVREIELWIGVNSLEKLTDSDIDDFFAPWIQKYKDSLNT